MGMVNINRPIHLALRDGYYEKFLGLLKYSFEGRPLASRKKITGSMVENLERANAAAASALCGVMGSQRERDFTKFLRVILDSARAVKFLVEHEEILEQDTSFLKRFLAGSPQAVTDARLLQRQEAEEFRRGVKSMVQIGDKEFQKLKAENFQSLSEDERRRYRASAANP
jgi:hypothetical protein